MRGLGAIYAIAFGSLAVQLPGLAGSSGIAPAREFLWSVQERLGTAAYYRVPTLFWLNDSDAFLQGLCLGGVVLAAGVVLRVCPGLLLLLLWLFYLSLSSVITPFMNFQWDTLLLETGFLSLFFASWRPLPRLARDGPPSRLALWGLRLLLFKLMFESGVVKLLSHDLHWRDLTALTYHYQTQPLPTILAWYAHQLPAWLQRGCVGVMFVVELALPFGMFCGRRGRRMAFGGLMLLQIAIAATGNYTFFNLLTMLLCLTLLDERCLRKRPPRRLASRRSAGRGRRRWLTTVPGGMLLAGFVGVSLLLFLDRWSVAPRLSAPLRSWLGYVQSFRTINNYGLFATMTTRRLEIDVQGSNDGKHWQSYGFRYKPGAPKRRPPFVAPHQPRLDWQMWFAALGSYPRNPWLVSFVGRLLEGSPAVLDLLAHNPFPEAPPQAVRALAYEYRFSTPEERRVSGQWWQRELVGTYLPPISRRAGGSSPRFR